MNVPFGVTTLKALLDSGDSPGPARAPDSLSSLRSPALDVAGRRRPAAGGDCDVAPGGLEDDGGSCWRDFTVMLKSSGIGAGTDTSIA